MNVQALILAGGTEDPLARYAHVPAKALCPLAGKAMGQYVVDILDRCDDIVHITYVGLPLETQPISPSISYSKAGESFLDSLRSGFDSLEVLTDHVLVCSADIPFITQAALKHFLANKLDADLIYSMVGKHSCETQFPAFKRTYVRLKGGVFTGGNLILIKHTVLSQLFDIAQQSYQLRKQPWRLATMLGPGVLLRLILGQLTVKALEQRISHITGISVRAFESPYASLATDIDSLEQLHLAENHFSNAHRGQAEP